MLRKFYLITRDDPRVEEMFRNDAEKFLDGIEIPEAPSALQRHMQNRMTVDQLAWYIGLECHVPVEQLSSKGLEFAGGPHGLSIDAMYQGDRLIGSMLAAGRAMPEQSWIGVRGSAND